MKNYFKKFSIIFVMALILGLGCVTNAFAADDFVEGKNNLNNTTNNSAKVGEALALPEIGWKRYDDTNEKIEYSNVKLLTEDSGLYMTSQHQLPRGSKGTIKINFQGTKFRIISLKIRNQYKDVPNDQILTMISKNVSIKIDGTDIFKLENLINTSNEYVYKCLVYESPELENTFHTLEITNEDSLYWDFDAIDIAGQLLAPGEVENPELPKDSDDKTGALLIINLTDGETKVFDVTSSEVTKFKNWYNNKSEYEDKLTYCFSKTVNSSISVDEYVVHEQITSFEVRKY